MVGNRYLPTVDEFEREVEAIRYWLDQVPHLWIRERADYVDRVVHVHGEEELRNLIPPDYRVHFHPHSREKDIELIMSQAGVSRERAQNALIQNNHDVVNAILDLTE